MATAGGNGFPRYTTYVLGAMEGEIRRYLRVPDGTSLPDGATEAALRNAGTAGTGPRRTAAPVRNHEFAVALPDGTQARCKYERQGPTLHKFAFYDAEGKALPRQWHTSRLDGLAAGIEGAAAEIAAASFREAIVREQREYFCRTSESPNRKKRPDRYQMTAARAKEMAGKYALCQRLGQVKLLPISGDLFEKLDDANAAWWKWHGQLPTEPDPATALVVGCCNRLDRCWEMPRYNPLYKDFEFVMKSNDTDTKGSMGDE